MDDNLKGVKDKLFALKGGDPALRAMVATLVDMSQAMTKLRKEAGYAWTEEQSQQMAKLKAAYAEMQDKIKEYKKTTKEIGAETGRQEGLKKDESERERKRAEAVREAQDAVRRHQALLAQLNTANAEFADREVQIRAESGRQDCALRRSCARRSWLRTRGLHAADCPGEEGRGGARAPREGGSRGRRQPRRRADKKEAQRKEKESAAELARTQKQYEQLGQAVGDALGQLAAGEMTFSQAFGAILQTALKQVMSAAMAQVTANASVAASGAAASQASIPVVGPGLAAAAMAAMFAMVSGLTSSIASASGGYDIPGTLNPLVQAHANEMILPAALAQKVRNMTDAGGSPVNVTLSVNAVDGKSVASFFARNEKHLVRTLSGAVRNRRA